MNLIDFLRHHQNPDGGWGYSPGKESATEAAAFALIALHSHGIRDRCFQEGLKFLNSTQQPGGGWSVSLHDNEPSAWVSALAALSIFQIEGIKPAIEQAAHFILKSFGRMPLNYFSRILLHFESLKISSANIKLGGWCWTPGTFPWVEPTCYALFFLKNIRRSWHDPKIPGIISEAEAMLNDRMCREGGWNYGNRSVLGEELKPYPLTTALALIALQDRQSDAENQKSLRYLKMSAREDKSSLSRAWGQIALDLYEVKKEPNSAAPNTKLDPAGIFLNIQTAALLLIAARLGKGENPFKF